MVTAKKRVRLCYGGSNKCKNMGYVEAKVKTSQSRLKTIRYCKTHAAQKGVPILW